MFHAHFFYLYFKKNYYLSQLLMIPNEIIIYIVNFN